MTPCAAAGAGAPPRPSSTRWCGEHVAAKMSLSSAAASRHTGHLDQREPGIRRRTHDRYGWLCSVVVRVPLLPRRQLLLLLLQY